MGHREVAGGKDKRQSRVAWHGVVWYDAAALRRGVVGVLLSRAVSGLVSLDHLCEVAPCADVLCCQNGS